MYLDIPIARATSSFPVPELPVISVGISPIVRYKARVYRPMSWVKIDSHTAARNRAIGMERPTMHSKIWSNAR